MKRPKRLETGLFCRHETDAQRFVGVGEPCCELAQIGGYGELSYLQLSSSGRVAIV